MARSPRKHGGAWTPVFDYMLALLGCFLIIVVSSKVVEEERTRAVETLGMVAVTIRWADNANDDVDLYLRNPSGVTSYFGAADTGGMHLEHDSLGTDSSLAVENGERVVVRAPQPGEYIANIHMYSKDDPGAQRVVVELWRLRGNDRRLTQRQIVLLRDGHEETAFRFTLDARGNVSNVNELPRKLVFEATGMP